MQNFYKSIYLLLITLMLPLAACINDDDLCNNGSKPGQKEGIAVEFSLDTHLPSAKGTRALLPPSGTPQEGSIAENYLDLDNLTFLLFDDKKEMLQILSPYVEPESTSSYVKYKVTAFLSDPYFLHAIDPTLDFTIVVLGNYQGLSPQRVAYAKGMKLEDLFDPAKVGTFAMPISNNWGSSWIPSIYPGDNGQQAGHIPMAGMQTFTVNTADLRVSTPEKPLVLSTDENGKDINMLRALAKIEIVDKIGFANNTQPDTENRSWIEKVELIGHSTRGSIFPTLDQWNRTGNPYETQYVRSTSVPTDNVYLGQQPTDGFATENDNATVNFFKDAAAVELRPNDNCQVFSCYLTEYDPLNIGTVYPMWMRLTIHGPGTAGTSSTLYRLEPAPYVDNVPGNLLQILRNNIYRYEITGIGTDVNVNLIVEDWDAHETIWNFTDNPGMTEDGYLTWAANPNISVTPSTAEVVIGNGATLTGSFNFDQPEDGKWFATLAPETTDDGTTELDAFIFVDAEGKPILGEDGSPARVISGDINGNPEVIRIVANYSPTTFSRRARLIFTVQTFDGRTITADVLDDAKYGKNTFFTIIQNASL